MISHCMTHGTKKNGEKMDKNFGKSWLGESRKKELERRVQALETHINDLEGRLTRIMHFHVKELHKGQDGMTFPPEEG